MSISPISSSMMSMYVPYVPTSKSDEETDYEEQLILQELRAYRIAPSGDKNADKARLEVAKRLASMQQTQGAKSKDSIPFEDIMNTLNISVTGDLQKDYNNTIDHLDYKISMAYSEEEKAYYQALKNEVEEEYISTQQNSTSTAFSGATQLGAMNRYMLGL